MSQDLLEYIDEKAHMIEEKELKTSISLTTTERHPSDFQEILLILFQFFGTTLWNM